MMRRAARHVFGFRQYGKMIPRDLSLHFFLRSETFTTGYLW